MTNQQGVPEALRQGHGIASEDGYFEARPQIDSMDRRKVFGAGFERGWEAALAAEPAQERIQALELEVRQLTEQLAELRGGAAYSLPEWLEVMHASEIRGIWNDCKRDGLHYVAFAWRIERLGWQRLLDALRSSRGKAPTQQPAPSAAPDDQMIAEYGRKASRMMARDQTRFDAACEVDKYLREEGAPGYYRHRMSIILFGNVEGTEASRAPENEAPQPSPTPQADSQPAPVLDMAVMQLAESVGLIGPASRVHDLHAAIQRFHDLICVNATIKAAVMAADAISGAAAPAQDYPPLPMQFACSGVFPVYSADQMRAYVDADRAARAPADSVLEDAARRGVEPR